MTVKAIRLYEAPYRHRSGVIEPSMGRRHEALTHPLTPASYHQQPPQYCIISLDWAEGTSHLWKGHREPL